MLTAPPPVHPSIRKLGSWSTPLVSHFVEITQTRFDMALSKLKVDTLLLSHFHAHSQVYYLNTITSWPQDRKQNNHFVLTNLTFILNELMKDTRLSSSGTPNDKEFEEKFWNDKSQTKKLFQQAAEKQCTCMIQSFTLILFICKTTFNKFATTE